MDKQLFGNCMNREITVNIDGVDGHGTIFWNVSNDSWYIAWKETTGVSRGTTHTTTITDEIINEIKIVGTNLVLIHPRKS